LHKELGLDSIGILALVFRFEESFSIDIAQRVLEIDVAKLKTVECKQKTLQQACEHLFIKT
jgi:acyl carrier protein